jgi:uncharacterized membrane protein
MKSKLNKIYTLMVLGIIGFIDSLYLLTEHFSDAGVVCGGSDECNLVLTSEYATLFGIPVAIFGIFYYATIIILMTIIMDKTKKHLKAPTKLLLIFSPLGLIASMWFTYLQAFVINAYCTYCLVSAATSTIIFIFSLLIQDSANNESAKQSA